MHKVKRKTVRIDTSEDEDLARYDEIQNNPFCSIIKEIQEKLTTTEYTEEGKPLNKNDRVVLIITYEEKELL